MTSTLLPALSRSLSPLALCRSSHRCSPTAAATAASSTPGTAEHGYAPFLRNAAAAAAAAGEHVGGSQGMSEGGNELNALHSAMRRCFEVMVVR